MAEPQHRPRSVPSDVEQVPIVWKYELLKYMRSWRLYGSLLIVAIIVVLIYVLPPAVGSPYNGTDRDVRLWVTNPASQGIYIPGVPPSSSVGFVNRSVVVANTIEVFQDGIVYPSDGGANWTFSHVEYLGQAMNIILFTHDTTGHNYTATYQWHSTSESFARNFVSFASILIIICATLFGADAIVSEYQARTGYLIFPNPIKRVSLFAGKFAASMTAGIFVVGLYFAATAILSALSVSGIDNQFLASFGFAVEYLLATMAVAYLISSLLKGTTGAMVLTFLLIFLILPIITSVGSIASSKPSWSLTFSANTMTDILSTPYPVDTVQSYPGAGITLHSYHPDPMLAAIVMLAYTIVASAISLLLFRRKQMVA